MKPTPEQIAKLPKWAQKHIENFRRERDNAERRLVELQDGQTESPIYTQDFVNGCNVVRYIQARGIYFKIDGREFNLEVRDENAKLYANRGRLVIEPNAGNAIEFYSK